MKKQIINKNNKLPAMVGILLLIVVVISTISGISAKYIHSRMSEGTFRSKMFYFTSNLLTEDGNAVYYLNPGTTELNIELRNYADELRISDMDIPYAISAQTTGGSGNVTLEQASGTIQKNSNDEKVMSTIKVTIPDGVTSFTIEATTVGQEKTYKKTISAKFHMLSAGDTFGFSTKQCDGYVELTVWTNEGTGDFNITVPEGLIPDRTNKELIGMAYNENQSNTVKITGFKTYESRKYRFFGESAGSFAIVAVPNS